MIFYIVNTILFAMLITGCCRRSNSHTKTMCANIEKLVTNMERPVVEFNETTDLQENEEQEEEEEVENESNEITEEERNRQIDETKKMIEEIKNELEKKMD